MYDKNVEKIDKQRHEHFKIKVCVSGAAEMAHLPPEAHEDAKALGEAIVKNGGIITTGATTGFPYWAALGAKRAGGVSIGLSPASNEREHVEAYKLPLDYMDLIIYTGFGYPGRDLFLTRASDAVIIGPGRIGTYHEFTIAYEDNKPLGILQSDHWDTDEVLKSILEKSHRSTSNIYFGSDPDELVKTVMEAVKKSKINDTFTSRT